MVGMKTLNDMAKLAEKKNVVHITPQVKAYCRFREFDKMVKYDPNKPYIRVSGEYLTNEERVRKDSLKQKSKWVANMDFISVVARSTSSGFDSSGLRTGSNQLQTHDTQFSIKSGSRLKSSR